MENNNDTGTGTKDETAEGADANGGNDTDDGTDTADAGTPDKSSENTGTDDSSAGNAPEDEKSGRKGKKKKREKKDPRDEKIAELNDRLLRNLAEFENFRNRSEKEKEARFDMGARTVVEKILPVVDNLERGLGGLTDEEKEQPFAAGILAVYKQLQTVFTEMGVTPIEAVGKEFDPNLHQAVMHDEDDSDVKNQVVEELQKGYMYKDTVVRYSMVKVLN
ncbi:MAG: nucleotide exchange factor GrpE [Eubacterium sp.]|nr:nucleotide exchange factor GrpE [Eubacterium sp.]